MRLRREKLHPFGHYGKNPHIVPNTSANLYFSGLSNAIFMNNGAAFWQYWSSEFDHKVKCTPVDGCVDLWLLL